MHVIMTGNPVDGFNLFGPFDTQEEANKFIDNSVDDIELWVMPVMAPVMLCTAGEG